MPNPITTYIETTTADLKDWLELLQAESDWPMKVRIGRFVPSHLVPAACACTVVVHPEWDFVTAPDIVHCWWFGGDNQYAIRVTDVSERYPRVIA